MFQNYSRRAQNVVFLARKKAGERGAAAIDIEDLLVALIIEDQGGFYNSIRKVAAPSDAAARVDRGPHHPVLHPDRAAGLLTRLAALLPKSRPLPPAQELPVSDGVRRVFAAAAALRDELGQRAVEPRHLLAAALGEPGPAPKLLKDAGVTRQEVVEGISAEPTVPAAERMAKERPAGAEPTPPYSQRARDVLFLAHAWATAYEANTVEVEHVLVALVLEDQGRFRSALLDLPNVAIDISNPPPPCPPHRPFLPPDLANHLLSSLEPAGGPTSAGRPGRPTMSEAVDRSLAVSDLLRQALQQAEVRPLHLLAAIAVDQSSRAGEMLRDVGITPAKVVDALRAN